MDMFTFARLVKEAGIPIGAFILCAWMVVYIVKRLAGVIDKLSVNLTLFMSKVKMEHENATKEHNALMEQHKEMITTLGRINGYK